MHVPAQPLNDLLACNLPLLYAIEARDIHIARIAGLLVKPEAKEAANLAVRRRRAGPGFTE